MKLVNDKPMWLSVPTIRDYEQYKLEAARVEGWNDAMEHIFGQRIKSCWVIEKNIGVKAICETCQNRERCMVYEDRL